MKTSSLRPPPLSCSSLRVLFNSRQLSILPFDIPSIVVDDTGEHFRADFPRIFSEERSLLVPRNTNIRFEDETGGEGGGEKKGAFRAGRIPDTNGMRSGAQRICNSVNYGQVSGEHLASTQPR